MIIINGKLTIFFSGLIHMLNGMIHIHPPTKFSPFRLHKYFRIWWFWREIPPFYPFPLFFCTKEVCCEPFSLNTNLIFCELVLTFLILQNDINCMDNSGNVTQQRQSNINEEIHPAPLLRQDAQRREKNGEEEFADVGARQSHLKYLFISQIAVPQKTFRNLSFTFSFQNERWRTSILNRCGYPFTRLNRQ